MGRRGVKAAARAPDYETFRLSVRHFKRELHNRVHVLKAQRMAAGVEENLEELYNLVVERGLEAMEQEQAGSAEPDV